MNNRMKLIFPWVLRILAAVILLQTLFFKFTGAEESVYIFTKLDMEPWGRIGTGEWNSLPPFLFCFHERPLLTPCLP